MRIVFMGTPDFAVPSLDALVNAGYDVVGVVTSTDKWGGRGNKKKRSPSDADRGSPAADPRQHLPVLHG